MTLPKGSAKSSTQRSAPACVRMKLRCQLRTVVELLHYQAPPPCLGIYFLLLSTRLVCARQILRNCLTRVGCEARLVGDASSSRCVNCVEPQFYFSELPCIQ